MKHLLIIMMLASTISVSGQLGGLRVYGGITTMTNQDEAANPPGTNHSGFHIGADGRLMSGSMSFLIGGRFNTVSLNAKEGLGILGHDDKLSIMNGRVGLGYSLFSVGEIFRVRTKALASFDVVLSKSGELALPSDFVLNDGWLGAVTGLGFDIGPAVLDVEYEIGLINAYNKKPGSKFNALTISAGFFF